jgi:hypothetical protein
MPSTPGALSNDHALVEKTHHTLVPLDPLALGDQKIAVSAATRRL